MKALTKMFSTIKGGIDITGVIVDVILVVALIPVITIFVSNNKTLYNSTVGNESLIARQGLSTPEYAIMSLIATFIVIGLVFMIGKQSGLIKSKK